MPPIVFLLVVLWLLADHATRKGAGTRVDIIETEHPAQD